MIDPKIPETIHATKNALPRTMDALDKTFSALVTIPSSPFLWLEGQVNYYLEKSKRKLQKRLDEIPEENQRIAPSYMAVPLIQDLFSYADCDQLHDMFINLLASSMDTRKEKIIHPAFVNVIKNLSPNDARALTCFPLNSTANFPAYSIRQQKGGGRKLEEFLPDFCRFETEGIDLLSDIVFYRTGVTISSREDLTDLSMITNNLTRQGIIQVDSQSRYTEKVAYENDLHILNRLMEIAESLPSLTKRPEFPDISIYPIAASITPFGSQFIQTCVK